MKMAIRTSVIGILICMIILFGLSWAWFTQSVNSSSNTIKAASFDLDITVKKCTVDNSTDPATVTSTDTVVTAANGVYSLESGSTYQVTLTRNSTASTGFCQIMVKQEGASDYTTYYTHQITSENATYSFTVSGFVNMKLTPIWGQSGAESSKLITNQGNVP